MPGSSDHHHHHAVDYYHIHTCSPDFHKLWEGRLRDEYTEPCTDDCIKEAA